MYGTGLYINLHCIVSIKSPNVLITLMMMVMTKVIIMLMMIVAEII